jgi:hypothetical protein
MAGITKLIVGELAQSKTKGKAFESELNRRLAPKAIATYTCGDTEGRAHEKAESKEYESKERD